MRGSVWQSLKALAFDGVRGFFRHGASSLAASIAFYTLFSLAPTLVLVIALAGFFFGEEAVRGEILHQVGGLVGKDSAEAMETAIRQAAKPASGAIASIISLGTVLVGASGAFAEMKAALNRVWEASPREERKGVWGFLRSRLLSLAMILVIAFLLLVSLAISAGATALATWVGGRFAWTATLVEILNTGAAFVIATAMFAAIYKILPDVKLAWRDVLLGALITAGLFELGKRLVGLYLGAGAVGSAYGAAGSLIVIFIWVYYATLIMLGGAEFTRSYAQRFGSLRGRGAREAPRKSDAAARGAATAATR
jgi:membrane protein